jgi:hypothetical protein
LCLDTSWQATDAHQHTLAAPVALHLQHPVNQAHEGMR